MLLPRFEYNAPSSINEAISILSGENAKVIAGGTDILPSMKQRRITPLSLVDIKGIEGLDSIKEDNGYIRIGTLATLRSIEESDLIKEKLPALAMSAGYVGAPQHRNAGTIGGNICLNTRCWYYNQSAFFRKCRPVCYKFGTDDDKCQLFPTREGKANVCYAVYSGDTGSSLAALGADVKICGPDGERVIHLMDIFTGEGKRPIALAPAELLTEVIVPTPSPYSSSAYLKYRVREAIDFPLIGVAAAITLDAKGGVCKTAQVVIGAVGPKPVIVEKAEAILKGSKVTNELLAEVGEKAFDLAKPLPNLLGCTPNYRKRLAKVFTKRAMSLAVQCVNGDAGV